MGRSGKRDAGRPAVIGRSRFHFAWAILSGLLVSACACGAPEPAAPACTGAAYYFPAGLFPEAYPASDKERRRRYSTVLARLGEPSLYCGDGAGETYRMMWLHDLAHPVVIRVARRPGRTDLVALQLSGTGGADPGTLLSRVDKALSDKEWQRLQAALAQGRFWSLPTSGNMYGVHGGQWVVEGRRGAAYHLVDRWTPSAGAYRDLGVAFFDLAGWQRPYSSNF